MEQILLYIAFVYLPIVCMTLFAYAKRNRILRIVFKTLLLPSLAVLYVLAAASVHPLVLLALLFGWIGDVFLLDRHHWNIYGGIASFAVGHIFYIAAMLSTRPGLHLIVAASVVWVAACLFLVRRLLLPRAPKRMRIAGAVYTLLLSGNCATALYLACVSHLHAAYVLCFFGGLLFMLSDGLIAYDMFGRKTSLGGFFIMVTYILAQTALIVGFVLHGGI